MGSKTKKNLASGVSSIEPSDNCFKVRVCAHPATSVSHGWRMRAESGGLITCPFLPPDSYETTSG